MLDSIASVLVERCGLDHHAAIVVGVSGGADSLCLMDVLNQLGYPIIVAHFNHKLRPEADSELQTVASEAARLGLPFVDGSADIRAEAKGRRLSIEEAARHLRYTFLFEQARAYKAQAVAVGHTADDQIETVLMHLIRGSGLDGLTGMSYRTRLLDFDPAIPIVRPLLGVWRAATTAHCENHALPAVHDPSNDSLDYFRNRVRHELIPALETYNPRVREALLRTAETLSADQALLLERIKADWQGAVIRQTPEFVAFAADRFARVTEAAQRYLLRLAVRHLAPDEETTYEMLNRAVSFVADVARVREDLVAGTSLIREAGVLYVCRGEDVLPADAWPQMPTERDCVEVPVPARIPLAAGWQLTSERVDVQPSGGPEIGVERDLFQVRLDAESLPPRLELRARRRGDRFQALGLGGHSQKISDLFVNEKLPARARRRWPLLCDGDLIVWIPGFRPAAQFVLRTHTRRIIRFSVTRGE